MTTIETRMTDLPAIWDDYGWNDKHFTVGSGKAQYCLWTPGPCGLYYCYRVDADGYACKRRAVEPTAKVFLHVDDK